jgi:hypothetical protein
MQRNFILKEPLIEAAEEFAKTSFDLYRLKAVDKSASLVSVIVSRGACGLAVLMFAVLANVGLSIWLGGLFNNLCYGFLCAAALNAVAALVIYFFFHGYIKRKIGDLVVLKLLS